jgi:hypothetical protein
MRRSFLLALSSFTVAASSMAFLAQGCGTNTLGVQDMCGWLGNDSSCYRRFAEGVVSETGGPACGVLGTVADDPMQSTTKRTMGAFASRDKLDVCFITAVDKDGNGLGGKIVFDPAIDPTKFPAPFGFKIVNPDGSECGTGTYTSETFFSITIDAPVSAGSSSSSSGSGGSTGTTTTSSSVDTSPISYGTFSIETGDHPQLLDTTCPATAAFPDGEAHKFNIDQLDKCPQYKSIVPTAQVYWSTGVVGKLNKDGTISGEEPGYIRLKVFYPPTDKSVANQAKDATITPVAVEYFDCQFPPSLPPCADGVKGDGESDVDCGGLICPKCVANQQCITASDCDSNCACAPDAMGVRRCTDKPTTKCPTSSSGSGGTGGSGGTTSSTTDTNTTTSSTTSSTTT